MGKLCVSLRALKEPYCFACLQMFDTFRATCVPSPFFSFKLETNVMKTQPGTSETLKQKLRNDVVKLKPLNPMYLSGHEGRFSPMYLDHDAYN